MGLKAAQLVAANARGDERARCAAVIQRQQKIIRALRASVELTAMMHDYPPAPMFYTSIQATWRKVARAAKKAQAEAERLEAEGAHG